MTRLSRHTALVKNKTAFFMHVHFGDSSKQWRFVKRKDPIAKSFVP